MWRCFMGESQSFPIVSPSICHEVMGPDAMILVFWMLSFRPAFSLSSFTFIKRLFSLFNFCHKHDVICISEVIDISPSNLFTWVFSKYFTSKYGIFSLRLEKPGSRYGESHVSYFLMVSSLGSKVLGEMGTKKQDQWQKKPLRNLTTALQNWKLYWFPFKGCDTH